MFPSPQPFALGQGRPWFTGPWNGGYVYVLPSAVLAGGTVAVAHPLRCQPRAVTVLATGTTAYPSRVTFNTTPNTASVVVLFESAQPAGTALFLY